MAKITIEALGLDIPAVGGGSIAKYFKNALKLRPAASAAGKLKNNLERPIGKVDFDEVRVGFTVEEDVDVGNEDTEWTIEAGSSTGFHVWNADGETVLSGDDFGKGSTLKVSKKRAYAGVDFQGSLTTGVEHELGDVTFGLDAESKIGAANYHPFPPTTPLKQALSTCLEAFVLPGDLADIMALPVGGVATVAGSGSLKFSVGGKFTTSAVPLSHDIPVVDTALEIKVGGSVGLSAGAAFRGAYEIRLHRASEGKVTLGYYKKRETEFDISVSVSAGASIEVGGTEVATKILEAVSGEPHVDRDFLLRAGLDDKKIDALKKVVADGVDRSLQASLEMKWSRLSSDEAAFLFTISPGSLDEDGRRAVSAALDGDLRPLTSGALPPGVKLSRSVVRDTLKTTSTIRLNLFGIFNYASVFELIRKGEVVYDAQTGDLQFLDEATANRMSAVIQATRAIPTEKISRLVSETVIVSHAFSVLSGRSLEVAHHYFEYRRRTHRRDAKDDFDVAVALGLLKPKKALDLTDQQGPGRSALKAETRYAADESRALFFADDSLDVRRREEYEKAGREALVRLESGDEIDDVRKILGLDDKLYAAIKKVSSRQRALQILSGVRYNKKPIPETFRSAIFSDYLTIVWWAKAMVDLGEALREVILYERKTVDHKALETDNDYLKLRKKLRKQSARIAKDTKSKFGEPWGLVAMDILGRPRKASVQITTDAEVHLFERSA